jgi:hypothetical protein
MVRRRVPPTGRVNRRNNRAETVANTEILEPKIKSEGSRAEQKQI